DPDGPVEIQPNFLAERADVDALVESVDMVLDLAGTSAYRKLIAAPAMPRGRLSRRDAERFVREHCSTFFHTCGTAALGSVVDESLKVFGTESLRVVDASVIPVIPTCNTQAPVIAIAERAADLIAGSEAART
ncbi:GMC oxidoreductase, partial [Actinomadura adrarensis]